ncbi:MAG TPA: tRNA (adenosine(37)-N6)-threonylcarbamoyltransferase complex dimerization subunit type 1 TsaB [Tepidisphaeraceae bacterium]|nr:tRNA (adenosine(37)-N6)-threonylcarbamoyltransferase complex dimerization subunit type 1 TsaB [Tepidisphaeraceae bacterium]
MIRAIAIETSGRLGSVALAEDGIAVAHDTFAHGLMHAAEMVPRIDALIKARGWKPADAREIYVSAGPGSFTGLRIGITFAKTLAYATGARAIAVPTVEVLARNAPPNARHVLIVLDAKRDQIFTARLTRIASDGWTYDEPAHLDSLANMLARSPRPIHLIGEGIPYHEKFLPAADPGIILTLPDRWRAQAGKVATIGYAIARSGVPADAQSLAPIYIRRPEAEEKYEDRSIRRFNAGTC